MVHLNELNTTFMSSGALIGHGMAERGLNYFEI